MASSGARKDWHLKKETELRCFLKEGQTLSLWLIEGTAEIFGIEMAKNKEYVFEDRNFAVFTWYGCTLQSSGFDKTLHESQNQSMITHINTHIQLEARRDVAVATLSSGPRVLVLGDTGKSTLCQILTAYAARLDRAPIYVDLDTGCSPFAPPGTISAVPIDKTNLSVEDGFINVNPLVMYFGHVSPSENPELFKKLVSTLANGVNQRLARDALALSSGIIVNTNGQLGPETLDLIQHCIQAFQIDVVLVINQTMLYSSLKTAYSGSKVVFVAIRPIDGVVSKDITLRKRLQKQAIKEYFYGKQLVSSINRPRFSPERIENLQLNAFNFYRVGGMQLSEGMKTVGQSSSVKINEVVKIVPSNDLVYSIVGVFYPPNFGKNDTEIESSENNESYLLNTNVAGFISIVQIDLDKGVFTILAPCPGNLPSNNLLVGSIKWVE